MSIGAGSDASELRECHGLELVAWSPVSATEVMPSRVPALGQGHPWRWKLGIELPFLVALILEGMAFEV